MRWLSNNRDNVKVTSTADDDENEEGDDTVTAKLQDLDLERQSGLDDVGPLFSQ